MRIFTTLFSCFFSIIVLSQQSIIFYVGNSGEQGPLPATITVNGTRLAGTTNSFGNAVISFPSSGSFKITVTSSGYNAYNSTINIPYVLDTFIIKLEKNEEELEEVIIRSTRISRTIANTPTRVETIESEEVDEKNNMRPGNVAMLLHESTGIQVQQTSATSGNSSIRIQGLDGRYTQLLKDGFPNFGNFSSGLSVLEIPPIDLQQVEIIKGPASPLYGGGAISGVINFISRTPGEEPVRRIILNASNIGQYNVGAFLSGRGKKAGFTMTGLYNHQKVYDVDKDDFTEVPDSDEITLHPKLFLYPNEKSTIIIGNSFYKGERTGGDVFVLRGQADANHAYAEKNESLRNISTFEWNHKMGSNSSIVAKQSYSVFDRSISVANQYFFDGIEQNAFTDISYINSKDKNDYVVGLNVVYNKFNEKASSAMNRDNKMFTGGLYAQHTWDASDKFKLESGLRIDAASWSNELYKRSEVFVLPRISALLLFSEKWSSRIGGGLGYKTPTLFTEQTETIQYQDVLQLNNVKSERSYGGTADVNFRTNIGHDLSFTFNQMFFYTIISKPLVLHDNGGSFMFVNAARNVKSQGFESNARFVFRHNLKLFLGYTFTEAAAGYAGDRPLPLVPKHKINSALIYEKEDFIKLGLEGYFTGKQYLSDGSRTPAFKELGFMVEKIFEKFSVFINFENFTDTRQSRYKNVVNGSHLDPVFDEIWTHTEGFVFNGGVKLFF